MKTNYGKMVVGVIIGIMAIAALLIRFYILIIASLEFDNWTKKLNRFQVQEIWNKEPVKQRK